MNAEVPAQSVDEMLVENMLLIGAIHECRQNGHDEQGSQYQLRLHKNLLSISQAIEKNKTDRMAKQQAAAAAAAQKAAETNK